MITKDSFSVIFSSSLRRDTFIYGAAVFFERIVSFLLLPLLTKTLPQELYGIWTQIIVTTGLLLNIVLVGSPTAVVRFLSGMKEKVKISRIFHAMMGIAFLNVVLVIILTLFFTPSLSKLMFGDTQFYRFVFLFILFLISEALFELLISFIRARQEIRLLSLYYTLKNVLRIGLLAIGLLLFHTDLFTAILFVVIFQLLFVVFIYFRDVFRKIGASFSFSNIGLNKILIFSIPLIPYTLMIWSNNFLDRYFILHLLDIKQVSIYAVAYSFAAAIGIFSSILGFTLYPYMSKHWNEGNKEKATEALRKAIEYYLFFAIPSVAILTLLSTPLVRIFTTIEYISSWQVFFWIGMGIAALGLYQLNFYSILLVNKTILNIKILGVAIAVNVTLNILLIPRIGIVGAAGATFISNSILALWTIRTGKKYVPYTFPWQSSIRSVFSAIVTSFCLIPILKTFQVTTALQLILFAILSGAIYIIVERITRNFNFHQIIKP